MENGETWKGLKVFIVEDEVLIAMALEDMLVDRGCIVVETAMSLSQAVDVAPTIEADLAVLDINLGRDSSYEVARILAERGVRLMYATGSGGNGAPQGWPEGYVLPKPFAAIDLERALNSVISGPSG